MYDYYEEEVNDCVNKFKVWAQNEHPMITEETDNGEWEDSADEFYTMRDSIVETIKSVPATKVSEQTIDNILYGIARDSECNYIVELLENYLVWYSVLCERCLKTNYINAKSQFAESLKNYKGKDGFQNIIYDFLKCGDEYTERMALKTLAYIYPEHAEEYAIEFWEREKYANNEYQKMMALHVLYLIKSEKLEYYLDIAEQSNYEYLKENAKEIRKELNNQK